MHIITTKTPSESSATATDALSASVRKHRAPNGALRPYAITSMQYHIHTSESTERQTVH